MLQEALNGVERQVVDQIGAFRTLTQRQDDVLMSFVVNMNDHFDELLEKETQKPATIFDFETLSLVQEEELDVMVALEGMVNASRNQHLATFISFNTRLSSLFPGKRIDESSNPLDPEQIAVSFQEALRPIGLDAQNSLAVYRAFNSVVLKRMDEVVREANQILIEHDVIPDLGIEGQRRSSTPARIRRRDPVSAFGTVEEESIDDDADRPELFSMMQNLLHTDEPASSKTPAVPGTPTGSGAAPAGEPGATGPVGPLGVQPVGADSGAYQQYMVPTSMVQAGTGGQARGSVMQPFQPNADQQVQMVDQAQLMEILTTIQKSLEVRDRDSPQGTNPAQKLEDVERLNISASLGEILTADQRDGVINAVDRQSSDVINLVTLLYEAIWDDDSVPIPIKELIGRTQVTIIKVALSDTEFFNREDHPARSILNEFAAAGIGWTEVEKLSQDPLYQKIQELVNKILIEYSGDVSFFEDLIKDFRSFLAREAAKTRRLEQSIMKAKERHDRVEDIHQLVTQKVEERLLGRELQPFVKSLLENQFHKFMVMLVLKEGPGSNAWKQAINTIDVLLWSIQAHEQEGDRDRLETINPRLLNNLRKALRIAQVGPAEVDELIAQLQEVQDASFPEPEPEDEQDEQEESEDQDAQQEAHESQDDRDEHDDDGALPPLELAQQIATDRELERVGGTGANADIRPDAASSDFVAGQDIQSGEPAGPERDKKAGTSRDDQTRQGQQEPSKAPKAPKDKPKQQPREQEETELADYLHQVDSLSVGMWVEFSGEGGINTRGKLAAKIKAIDKFIFVNQQGVKVVEKTKLGLAHELKDRTVKIISDGLLFSRALESVIGNLRENARREQTGSAYKPGTPAPAPDTV